MNFMWNIPLNSKNCGCVFLLPWDLLWLSIAQFLPILQHALYIYIYIYVCVYVCISTYAPLRVKRSNMMLFQYHDHLSTCKYRIPIITIRKSGNRLIFIIGIFNTGLIFLYQTGLRCVFPPIWHRKGNHVFYIPGSNIIKQIRQLRFISIQHVRKAVLALALLW